MGRQVGTHPFAWLGGDAKRSIQAVSRSANASWCRRRAIGLDLIGAGSRAALIAGRQDDHGEVAEIPRLRTDRGAVRRLRLTSSAA